ncbi:MAG TPA: hypothetical protein VEA16_16730, partial [Vicinamibacterales bacterium]|nr:hypothetical protein [Vicinamibacterales bacterium]
MIRFLAGVFILAASSAGAQVSVEWRPEKPAFLQGEPIYLVLRVTNTSAAPIGYHEAWMLPQLRIVERASYPWREGCGSHGGVAGGGSGASSHPPTFAPGQSLTFRYLLRGYRLEPGRHSIHVQGYLPVTIQDSKYEADVAITVVEDREGALRGVVDALLARAKNNLTRDGVLARAGVFEAALPAHVAEIARLTTYDDRSIHYPASAGYETLADINTSEARAELRRLYDEQLRLDLRLEIVQAISRLSAADNLEFLLTLLPGRSTAIDDRIRRKAIDGLLCIGGDTAA